MSESKDATVTSIAGEPTRFMVASDAGKPPYLVDLRSYEGNSQCDCIHFTTRLKPKLDAGERDWSEERTLMCKHGKRAYWAFARDMVLVIDKNL